jgi:hypothetical protein
MKKKVEIEYNSKQELITMILRLWDSAPNSVARQNMMEFLISNYRGVDLSSLKALNLMPYDELEKMYLAMKFVSNK